MPPGLAKLNVGKLERRCVSWYNLVHLILQNCQIGGRKIWLSFSPERLKGKGEILKRRKDEEKRRMHPPLFLWGFNLKLTLKQDGKLKIKKEMKPIPIQSALPQFKRDQDPELS
jgi:hypothetical protein